MNDQIIERNLNLLTKLTDFILQHPGLLDQLPADFQLVILPEDDPELSLYNLNLLTKQTVQKPVIMVRLNIQQFDVHQQPPQLYIPLAA